MSLITSCSEEHFTKVFNDRDFNPPSGGIDFDSEFESALDVVRTYLQSKTSSDTFSIYEGHNNSRFIDVTFSTEDYLDAQLLHGLQSELSRLPNDWMVCLWEACFMFVTSTEIFGFDPTFDDPVFKLVLLAGGQANEE